ncbi:MAG TPA: hypothetical protein VFW33_07710, partial [Gemmataceae bacterium]|nr:hypothetical protein [Gemmataceae bacterium]
MPRPLTAARFSADTTLLAVGAGRGRVFLHEGAKKVLRELPTTTGMEVQALAWSPDARRLAVGTQDGTIQMWSVSSTHPALA